VPRQKFQLELATIAEIRRKRGIGGRRAGAGRPLKYPQFGKTRMLAISLPEFVLMQFEKCRQTFGVTRGTLIKAFLMFPPEAVAKKLRGK